MFFFISDGGWGGRRVDLEGHPQISSVGLDLEHIWKLCLPFFAVMVSRGKGWTYLFDDA
jgi:hypothetical protein